VELYENGDNADDREFRLFDDVDGVDDGSAIGSFFYSQISYFELNYRHFDALN